MDNMTNIYLSLQVKFSSFASGIMVLVLTNQTSKDPLATGYLTCIEVYY